MNPMHQIIAIPFMEAVREMTEDRPRKVDELALWHADKAASGGPTPKPRTLNIGPFTYWLRQRPQTQKE